MTILILTHYGDVHSMAVAWALRRLGAPVREWHISEFPAHASWSIVYSKEKNSQNLFIRKPESENSNLFNLNEDIRVVWNRRMGRPVFSKEIDEIDIPFVKREVEYFKIGALECVAPNAIWVNPLNVAKKVEGKAYQLMQAKDAGLSIPDTLMTNEIEMIKNFVQKYESVIYKPFRVPVWEQSQSQSLAVTMTTKITPYDISKNLDSLSLAPGIFQEYIPKRREIRITVYGNHFSAIDIFAKEKHKDDWRSDYKNTKIAKSKYIPDFLKIKILKFMENNEIKFGCFDFIETFDGVYIFLEVNQMGQFLWIEDAINDIRLLDGFSKFLCKCGKIDYDSDLEIKLSSFYKSNTFNKFKKSFDEARFAHHLDRGMIER